MTKEERRSEFEKMAKEAGKHTTGGPLAVPAWPHERLAKKRLSFCCTLYAELRRLFIHGTRRIGCLILGHVPNCYLRPVTEAEVEQRKAVLTNLGVPHTPWRRAGHGWCAYCARHVKEPARLRAR
jgi:hypothetical protein